MTTSNVGISDTAKGHWPAVAKLWAQLGTPLRPVAQDISFFSQEVNLWTQMHGTPRVMILGVTPELYHLPWTEGTDILAVDHTQSMIDCLWPGPRNAAILADWTDLPLPAASREIVLCDGGFHLLSYPNRQQQLVANLEKVITAGGLFIVRLYVPPANRESSNVVLSDLLAAKISNLNVLKLRLGMAMQDDAVRGTALKNVWQAIHNVAPDLSNLSEQIGWSYEHLSAINTYENSPNTYHFVSVDEVENLFCRNSSGFALHSVHVPTYELGEQCPTVVFRRI